MMDAALALGALTAMMLVIVSLDVALSGSARRNVLRWTRRRNHVPRAISLRPPFPHPESWTAMSDPILKRIAFEMRAREMRRQDEDPVPRTISQRVWSRRSDRRNGHEG